MTVGGSGSRRGNRANTGTRSIERAVAIKTFHDLATLFIEQRPVPALLIDLLPDTSASQVVVFAETAPHLYRLRNVDLGWRDKATFDYTALTQRIDALLGADSQAWFVLEVPVDAPAWWLAAHPLERVEYCLTERVREGEGESVSWASRRWRTEAGEALARLVRHVRRMEGGARCLGFQIAFGAGGEWRYPEAERLPDIGLRMNEQFREFALEKYRHNTGLLRRAWFDARAEFDSVTCPNAEERRRGDIGVLRNPHRSRRVLDYYGCFFETQNAAALHFCEIVKSASDGQALAGLAYAPVFGGDAVPEGGHAFPEPVLGAPAVDFIANAGPGDGGLYLRALSGSLALRGKLLVHVPAPDVSPASAAALAVTQGVGLALPANWPAEDLRKVRSIMERGLRGPSRAAGREVAVIVDPASAFYVASGESISWFQEALLSAQMRELTRMGAPFDVYMLADLFHPQFPTHKVTLFLNTLYLSEAERRRVDARVKRGGQYAAWLWAPGVIGEAGVNGELGQQVCGQKLRLEPEMTQLRTRIVASDDPLTWGQHIGATFGTERPLAPTVTVADRGATRLGANTANKTVFSARRSEAWTSVVYGSAPVPAALLRNLMRAAECHLYLAEGGDAEMVADGRVLAIATRRGGTFKISLPGRFDVREGWTETAAAQAAADFTVTLTPGSTVIYELRPSR